MNRHWLFATACSLALAFPALASAQAEPSAGASIAPILEELVVTAQRRDERLQDVPISVTAISEARLETAGVSSTEDLTLVTPGLVFARSTSFAQPTIRGIGSRNSGQGDESSVALYIDGVYRPDQSSNFFELNGVERIEVLKGPQGTLFGRNATGGAISITTKMPADELEGTVSASVGEFGFRKGGLYVSGPLAGGLKANLAVTALADDGFVRNIILDQDTGERSVVGLRGKLLWDIDDATRLWLGVTHYNGQDNTNQSGQPLNGNSRGRRNASVIYARTPWTSSTEYPVFSKLSSAGADLHFERDFSGFNLKVVAAYSENEQHNWTDADNTSAAVSANDTQFRSQSKSLEVIAASTGERRLNWTLGANIYSNDATLDPFTSGAVNFTGDQNTRAASAFGEAVWEAVDSLFLTFGLRYSYEEREAMFLQRTPTVVRARGDGEWTDLSPRLVVRYQFAPNSNVYASYTRGFKSGTFNPSSAVGTATAADPEHVDAFEVGVRADIGGRLRLGAAAYYYDYQDLQVTVPLFVNGATTFALSNAGAAVIQGLEANAEFAVTDELHLRGGASVLDATYEEFKNAVVVIPDPALFFAGAPAGNMQVVRDVSGNDLSRSPAWTLNVGADYKRDLFGGTLGITADIYSTAKFYAEPFNRVTQPAYTQVNASVTWTAPEERWSLQLSGENLTDAEIYSSMFSSAIGDFVAYQRPSFVSLTARYNF